MYRILIVDDEKREREGISKLINRYQFELHISQAENGEEALQLLEKESFDILLTDIKMPFMNGIELIEQVRNKGIDLICIIYSAYGEFEYAQNAISLGVLEYLLKPIRLDAFEQLFRKVIGICQECEEQKEKTLKHLKEFEEIESYKFHKQLIAYLEGDRAEIPSVTIDMIDFDAQYCIPILISGYSNLFAARWEEYEKEIQEAFGPPSVMINKDDNQILILLFHQSKRVNVEKVSHKCEQILEISREKHQTEIFIIIGSSVKDYGALKIEYQKMQEQLDYQFFISESTIVVHERFYNIKKEQDTLPLYFERLNNYASLADFNGIKGEFQKIFTYIKKQTGFSSLYVKYVFTDAVKRISDKVKSDISIMEYAEYIYEAKSFDELNGIVTDLLVKMEQSYQLDSQENRIVRMAKEYIYEHYKEYNLGVSSIADSLNVSAAYLSSLFKMETKKNLSKYITVFRIEKAKELLTRSNMRVSDIAEQVGYRNASYFISIFRNQTGISPTKYREEQ